MNLAPDTTNLESSHLKPEIDRIFAAQQAHRWAVAKTDAPQRIAKLKRLMEWIYDNRFQIHKALEADFKKSGPEVDLSEIWTVTSEIKYAIKHLKGWMRPKRVRPTLAMITTQAWIRYEPKGIALIIAPWNFPFTMTLGPLVAAIAAGNCVILKPSELTPNCSRLITEMATELFPENEVAVIEGDREAAIELLKKPFDHIFFTGSPETGKKVMLAAADHLTSITLELGGKSPTIIDETADITDAAKKIVWGKFMNGGQTCIAPDYLLVHNTQYPNILEALKKEIKKVFGETPAERQDSQDLTRIVNGRHFDRIKKLIDTTTDTGGQIEMGGEMEAAERYIAPTILTGVKLNSPVMQEEIFGPVLPVIAYQSLEEVIQIINSKEKPLALYIFSKSDKNIETILSGTSAGGSCINDVVLHFLHLNLPFGGVNHSGIGNAHGFYGFKAFSHERAILKHSRYSPMLLLSPPYTKVVKKLINFVIKYI